MISRSGSHPETASAPGRGASSSASLESAPAPGGGATAKRRATRGSAVDIKKLVRSRIKVCHALAEGEAAGTVTAVVKVSADGAISVVSVKASDAALAPIRACARSKIAKLSAGGAKPGTYSVIVKLK